MPFRTALIVDSTSDLPLPLIEQYEIIRVPLYVIWGADELKDGIDLTAADFYNRLTTDPIHPKTTQPTPQDFASAYEEARKSGAEEIVIITLSSELSGTHNSALQAKESAEIPVHIHDSRTTSMSLGWQVLAAARLREQGATAQSMIEAADYVRRNSATMLTVDTLEYLHKGGRIGNASKLIGTALNIKPRLYVDHLGSGKVELGDRTRTRKKAIEALYSGFFEALDTSRPLRIAITHGNTLEEAEALAERIEREYRPVELIINMTSPVVGVHTGPGTIALCGMSEKPA